MPNMAGTSLNSCSLLLLFVAAVNGIVYDPGGKEYDCVCVCV